MPRLTQHTIGITDAIAFRQCRQAWYWSSPLGCNLRPTEKHIPYFVGSLVHYGLECITKGSAAGIPLIIAEYVGNHCTVTEAYSTPILDACELAIGILQHYQLWQKHDTSPLADKNLEFISNEADHDVTLWSNTRNAIKLASTFDRVVHSKIDGNFYLVEYKTTSNMFKRFQQLQLDAQLDAYLNNASRTLDVPITGIIYTLLRKKVPEFPNILKTGLLSTAPKADTTAEWFLACAKQHHSGFEDRNTLIKAHYGDYLNTLLNNLNKYFTRAVVTRSNRELNDSWYQLQETAKEMVAQRTPIYRNENTHCGDCAFRAPCIAKRQGLDYQAILQSSYEQNVRIK